MQNHHQTHPLHFTRAQVRLEQLLWTIMAVTVVVILAAGAVDEANIAEAESAGPPSRGTVEQVPDVVDYRFAKTYEYRTVDIAVLDGGFDGQLVRVDEGTKVRWHNEGTDDHDVRMISAPARSDRFGVATKDFPTNATYEVTFDESGVYLYTSTIGGRAARGAVVVGDYDYTQDDRPAPGRNQANRPLTA